MRNHLEKLPFLAVGAWESLLIWWNQISDRKLDLSDSSKYHESWQPAICIGCKADSTLYSSYAGARATEEVLSSYLLAFSPGFVITSALTADTTRDDDPDFGYMYPSL